MARYIQRNRSHLVLSATCFALVLGATAATGSVFSQNWATRFNGPANGNDTPQAIRADSAGNVVVAGSSAGAGTGLDYAIVKYDPHGTEVWTVRYNGPGNGEDVANAVAVDGAGNVFVTGRSAGNGTGDDVATLKFDSAGNLLWTARYNGPGGGHDGAVALVVDAAGNAIVTGYSDASQAQEYEYATVKYDPEGNQEWVSHYHLAGNTYSLAKALTVDPLGDVYVTGESYVTGDENGDFATLRYNGATGAQLWVSRYDGPRNFNDSGNAIALDSSGNVFVTGYSDAAGVVRHYDFATLKYAPNGALLWLARYNGPANSEDVAYSLAVDAAGDVIVSGNSGHGLDADYATVKYAGATGDELWASRCEGHEDLYHPGNDLALDSAGHAIITGQSDGFLQTRKFSGASGVQLDFAQFAGFGAIVDLPCKLAVDAADNVYVTAASTGGGTGLDISTVKYRAVAASVTASCQVTRGGLRKSLGTGRYSQVVTVKNTSASPIDGPISLVLDSLSPTATLFNKTGDTAATSPAGSPYRNAAVGSLAPGASVAITLEFTNPTNVAINYTHRILAGSGAR